MKIESYKIGISYVELMFETGNVIITKDDIQIDGHYVLTKEEFDILDNLIISIQENRTGNLAEIVEQKVKIFNENQTKQN